MKVNILDKALEAIDEALGDDIGDIIRKGLPDGSSSKWGYDKKLAIDIAKACESWMARCPKIEEEELDSDTPDE